MSDFLLPRWVKHILSQPLRIAEYTPEKVAELKQKLARLAHPNPIVSVVVPAWNEEEGILHTLWSLANTNTQLPTEFIVVDNNSTDGTSN